ncbi:MAG: hypothetical protein A2W99_10565 [Bacteroidetes bacterium GWF2_33_16]|nr:MAG: hypothetical protein A2X00_05175 [Bacteroidetes bacterium GWE2_32_14]OFY03984.1 MAG: hypothetical protein A2W99_10565 [Bacteroidetes bacterium GWF2_33_16]
MDIKDYIKDLLLKHEGLVIPDLGGFVSEYEPAAFDVNESKFLPPTKKLYFKPEFSFEDSVFADYIAKKENINLEDAKKKISEFAIHVKKEFKKGLSIDIKDVGVLSQTKKGVILFEQDKNLNLLTESFGLKSVKIKPLSEKTISKQLFTEKKPRKSFKKPILLVSAVIVIIALVFLAGIITEGFSEFSFFSSIFSSKKGYDNQQEVLSTKSIEYLDSIAKADSIKASINKILDVTTVKKDALFYTEQKKEQEFAKTVYVKFDIIAGSFQSLNKAEIFCKELNKKGYKTEIIESDSKLFRISIATFTSEEQALKELYRLRASSEIKQVWILKSN